MMKNCIAERKLIAEFKETGERREFTIRIGTPYWLPNEDFATCPVEWDGLFNQFADAKGIDLLQAVQLASHIDPLLRALEEKYNFFLAFCEPYFDEGP